MHWRRKWQPTPVFLLGEPQGQGSLVGCIYGVAQSRTWLKQLSSSSSQSYAFSSSHVWMWELDHKESWALKNWCFQTVALKKTLESPSVCKEIKPVNPKENQPWIFIGRTDAEAEAEALILWPPSAKSQLIGQNPDAGKDWRQEEKGMTEDELVGWHHQLNGHESEWSLGGSEGQGSLECCSPWSHKEPDMTEWLNLGIYSHF